MSFARRMGLILIWFAIIFFWCCSMPSLVQKFIDQLQNQYQPLNIAQLNIADTKSAIVVLGAGVENALEYDDGSRVSDRTSARLQYAVYLHQQTHLPIYVSGGNRNLTALTEAKAMQQILNNYYHIAAMIGEDKSKNTYDESLFILPILKDHQIKTIYLVTDAWHMPRSMYIFSKHFQGSGIKIIPAPMGVINFKTAGTLAHYLPLINALNAYVFAAHEYVGLIWYRAESSFRLRGKELSAQGNLY